MNAIGWVTWLLGIIFPVILLACAAKLVAVRTEIRLRDAQNARERLAVWLRRSIILRRRHDAALRAFETAARDRSLRSPIGMLRGVAAGVSAILALWIQLRAMPGHYLARDCHGRIRRHMSYLATKEEEYRAGLAKDLAGFRETLLTGVDWKTFFGNNGRLVFFGVLAMLASATMASAFGWRTGSAEWMAVAGAVSFITLALVGVVAIMNNSHAISYSWGCVFVLVIALTTIEFSPLGDTWFDEAIDAQKVTTMFIGVGIVLTLSQLFDQRGMGPSVSLYERRVIKQSYRPAVPLRPIGISKRRSSGAKGGRQRRASEDEERLQGGWMEMFWVCVVLTLYGLSVGQFLSSTLQDAKWGTDQGGHDFWAILPILTATICTLALPLMSLARATKTRAFASVVALITALLVVGIAIIGDGDDDKPVEVEPPPPDTLSLSEDTLSLSEDTLSLSEDGRRILERDVYFDFGSLELTANAEELLCLVSWVLRENDWLELMVVGHTDSIGSQWFNDNLGSERANAVREFVVANGVDSARVATESLGERRPQSMELGREGQAWNRRVEFEIRSPGNDPQREMIGQSGLFDRRRCLT